ncbi:MAG: NUDIX domain-containing protein [Proteobacteria bacterium]|nr:NUDIX domain-containing protein [Pseudomonadota bacterium]
MSPIRQRRAVRALLLDNDQILLVKAELPDGRHCWMTPGGGVEHGETDQQALRREVWEETSFVLNGEYPLIWIRNHLYGDPPRQVDQHEYYFLIRTSIFDASMHNNPAEGELEVFRGFKWWSINEIAASNELFSPNKLADLLSNLLAGAPPEQPIRIGI